MKVEETFNFFKDFVPQRDAEEQDIEDDMTPEEIEEYKSMAILSYIPVLCFIPFFKGRNNRFAYKHAKQGIILFLFEAIALLGAVFWKAALLLAALASLVGVIMVLQGKLWTIPLIGILASRFDKSRNTEKEEEA